MFQNSREVKTGSEVNKLKEIAKRIFKPENVILYIIATAISMVSFLDEMNPFSMAYLAAVYLSGIPVFGVLICTSIGVVLAYGKVSLLMYILSAIVFIGLVVAFKAKKMDEENEIGIKLFVSVLLVGLVKNIGNTFLLFDTLTLVVTAICTVVFYFIFLRAIPFISEKGIKKAFTKEELIATSIMIIIAISALGDFAILNFRVKDVLSILVILILGWKNGALVGTAAGISISVILAIAGLRKYRNDSIVCFQWIISWNI